MDRRELKKYRYNQERIKGDIEYYEEYKTNVMKITTTLSDMPRREQRSSRQYGGKDNKISRL